MKINDKVKVNHPNKEFDGVIIGENDRTYIIRDNEGNERTCKKDQVKQKKDANKLTPKKG